MSLLLEFKVQSAFAVTVASSLVTDWWKTSLVCMFSAAVSTALLLIMVFMFNEMERTQESRNGEQ